MLKLNLKKTAAAVLALGSSAVFAGTMGPVCTPGAVTVPCESTAWDFGVQALYLEHTGTDFFGERRGPFGTNPTGYWNQDGVNSDWEWGFKLEGSYHFGTGNDIDINWYHFNPSHRFDLRDFTLTAFDPSLDVADRADWRVHLRPEWDAVNFEFGQLVNFGEHKVIRFHGGVQYAHIKHRRTFDSLYYINTPTVLPLNGAFVFQEEFNGAGPRVGMDMSYHIGNGFAIYANGATALLVGETRHHALDRLRSYRLRGDRDEVVPEMEAKIGAMYTYATGSGDFTLDAGYMVTHYWNALHTGFTGATDFSVDGVYFGAKWVGNVA